jgi:hypothetical protein
VIHHKKVVTSPCPVISHIVLLTAMPFIPFKLRKANAPSRFAHFDGQPSWADLASKITQLFIIPPDRVGIAFITKDKEPAILSNEQDLQLFYGSLDQSSEEIKFIVQDLQTPDCESAFSLFFLNTHQPHVTFPPPISHITYPLSPPPCLFLITFITCCLLALPSSYSSPLPQPQTQSLQLGQWTPLCLIYPRAVSNQQGSDP